jgi:hypothetical protein
MFHSRLSQLLPGSRPESSYSTVRAMLGSFRENAMSLAISNSLPFVIFLLKVHTFVESFLRSPLGFVSRNGATFCRLCRILWFLVFPLVS